MKKIIFKTTIVAVAFSLCFITGCREKYIVGIVPVYTEENWYDERLSITERLNIEQGYHEAVMESKRYNKTIDPLYLQCFRYTFGYSDCSKSLNPHESWKDNVREFYETYYFKKKVGNKKLIHFMEINGINLLIMSTYTINHDKNVYDIELKVSKFFFGSDESITKRWDIFSVKGFKDSERLRLMSKESLMRIMSQIEKANPS